MSAVSNSAGASGAEFFSKPNIVGVGRSSRRTRGMDFFLRGFGNFGASDNQTKGIAFVALVVNSANTKGSLVVSLQSIIHD